MTLEVALVIVGDELLTGERLDANGPWMAARLTQAGARVVSTALVGDATEETARAVSAACAHADVVIVGGGLGPTDDDGTRAALAHAAGVELAEDAEALEWVRAAQRARGFALDARRRLEARLPVGASCLANPEGTAPGIAMRVGRASLFALPGVPRELQAMFDTAVLPRIAGLGELDRVEVASFRTCGLREPDVADALVDLDDGTVALGLYPHQGEQEIRFSARGAGARDRVDAVAAEARRRLGPAVYENVAIEHAVVEALRDRGLVVTTAESLTGGLVARMLTAVPGASDVFRGGWVAYSDAWKAARLGVPEPLLEAEGAVSEAVACAMADGALEHSGADVAIALTGFAGPGDGAAPDGSSIPQGTYFVGLARTGRRTVAERHLAPHARTIVQRRAAVHALDVLRRALGQDG